MRPKLPLALVSLALMLVGLGGCNVLGPFYGQVNLVGPKPKPIGGPSGTAGATARVSWDFVKVHEETDWTSPGFEPVDMLDLADRVHARIERSPAMLAVDENDLRLRYPTRVTIVCVNPPVALIEPVPVEISDLRQDGGMHVPLPLSKYFWFVPGRVDLPHGVDAGRRVATRAGTEWIDLSSFDTPRPIVADADGRARLPVWWGHLELRPSGRGWKVRARISDATEVEHS